MFCTACGTRNAEESNYCKQCGHKLEKAVPPRISEVDFDRTLPEEEQVSALLERAYRLRKAGERAAAISLCEEALRLRPESTSAHSLLGQLHEQNGDKELAIREYERVLELNPGSIADRVKLDELRDGDLPVRASTAPQILLADHPEPRPNGRNVLATMVAIAALLLIIAGVAYSLHARSKVGSQNTVASTNSASPTVGPVTVPAGGQPLVSTQTGGNTGTTTPVIVYNPYPLYPYPSYPSASPYPPPGYGTAPRYRSQPSSSAPTRLAPASVRVTSVDNKNGPTAPDSEPDNSRVRLPEDNGDGNEVTIKVSANGATPAGDGGNPKTTIDPNAIRVHTDNNDAAPSGSPASSSARSMIYMADDLKTRGEYRKALEAYSSALPSAGDQTANVHQEMALCYQSLNERTNAVAHFKQAKDAYQKLLDQGRMTESARAGIRVCEHGIKACSE